MPPIQTFKGFFSYAHLDATTSPGLVDALTVDLKDLVSAKLLNASLAIWQDRTHLRTGDRWDPAIEDELRHSDILIVLFTPSWIQSDLCRKEYLVFEEVEVAYGGGGYVVPILVRSVEHQERYLTPAQRPVYESIRERQYFPMLAPDFLARDKDGRRAALEKIADDVVGILERRRDLAGQPAAAERPSPRRRTAAEPEFSRSVQDFEKVDFVSNEEVVIDRQAGEVYAQVDFVERLAVASSKGNSIVFSVRQAYLNVENHGPGCLSQADDLRDPNSRQNAFFVRLYDLPNAISICIDPVSGKTGLAELALPPARNENRLSRIATANGEVGAANLTAELRVALDATGLRLPEGPGPRVDQSKRSQIKALILEVARKRYEVTEAGEVRRPIEVRERAQ